MAHGYLILFVIFTNTLAGRKIALATDKKCIAAYFRRKPCGYENIPQDVCEITSGCCYDSSSTKGIPKCYQAVAGNTLEKCSRSETGRRACGYRSIAQNDCRQRGCCFQRSSRPGIPRCYRPTIYAIKPSQLPVKVVSQTPELSTLSQPRGNVQQLRRQDDEPDQVIIPTPREESLTTLLKKFLQINNLQNATRSCAIAARSRTDCGHPGISRTACEARGCCWDSSILATGVYWCFSPAWRQTVPSGENGEPSEMEDQGEQTTKETTVLYEPPTPSYGEEWDTTFDVVTDTTKQPMPAPLTTNIYSPTPKRAYSMSPWYTTATTEVLPPYEDPPAKIDASVMHSSLTTTPIAPATAVPTEHATTRKSSNTDWHSAQYMLRLLNYYTAMNSARPPTSKSDSVAEACAARTTSCCHLDPSSPCCEYSSAKRRSESPDRRIVGGRFAGHLRSSVAYLTTNTYGSQFCGGTLIAKDWVVTAAHCVLDYCSRKKRVSEVLVKLGKVAKSNFVRGEHEQIITARDVICHPQNCKSRNQPRLNDIALVKLSRPITPTVHVFPAALPSQGQTPSTDRKCVVLGWGETRGRGPKNALKEVHVPLYTNEQCNKPDWRRCMVRGCMMCAGELNMDACEGDSGGPLFCEGEQGRYVLHGIYSWGRCGAEEKKPAVYTRFSYYADWTGGIVQSSRNVVRRKVGRRSSPEQPSAPL